MFKQILFSTSMILVYGITFAAGLIGSRLLFYATGLTVPRLPSQAPESMAGFYLLAGSILLSGGLALLAKGIGASFWVRWLALAFFIFLGFAVSTSVETSIYSNVSGMLLIIPVLILPCILLSGVLALPLSPFPGESVKAQFGRFFHTRSWLDWAWRIGATILSFPLIYFVFGLIVSPIVMDYYAEGASGLALPEPILIVQVQFLRSVIHLVAAFPVIILWKGDRRRLIIALALAFFVFVFAYDIVLANEIPLVLVVVHGVEVLVGSFVYAWALVYLLLPGSKIKTKNV